MPGTLAPLRTRGRVWNIKFHIHCDVKLRNFFVRMDSKIRISLLRKWAQDDLPVAQGHLVLALQRNHAPGLKAGEYYAPEGFQRSHWNSDRWFGSCVVCAFWEVPLPSMWDARVCGSLDFKEKERVEIREIQLTVRYVFNRGHFPHSVHLRLT